MANELSLLELICFRRVPETSSSYNTQVTKCLQHSKSVDKQGKVAIFNFGYLQPSVHCPACLILHPLSAVSPSAPSPNRFLNLPNNYEVCGRGAQWSRMTSGVSRKVSVVGQQQCCRPIHRQQSSSVGPNTQSRDSRSA